MDKFIKIKRDTRVSGFIGDVITFNSIATIIDNNDMICVYGPSGVGKTYMVSLALKNKNWVEISSLDEIPLLACSTCHVVIDSDKIDKSFLNHKKKVSLGSTIFITKTIDKIDFCDCIKIAPPSIETLIQIGRKESYKTPIDHMRKCAEKCGGDIRTFIFSLQFETTKDTFKTSKSYIYDKLSSTESVLADLGKDVSDHGYIWDIVYTNYMMGGLNPEIADSLSSADIIDSKIYNNSWELIDYFWLNAITYPIEKMSRPLERQKIKPGVSWTKFSNYKMKKKKLQSLPPNDICRTIIFMLKRLSHEESIKLLKSYNIKPKDVDVLNLLYFDAKLPVKTVKRLKSDLSSAP
jgi:hypothetical protein